MKKINNSFKEEFTSISIFVLNVEKNLKRKQKSSKLFWVLFSTLIAISNIAILIISSIALKLVIEEYYSAKIPVNFWSNVVPTAGVSAVSILIFILSIVISIYQGSMKSRIYLKASERIQYESIKYLSKENNLTEEKFRTKISLIQKSALKTKTKKTFKKSIISILTGGTDE